VAFSFRRVVPCINLSDRHAERVRMDNRITEAPVLSTRSKSPRYHLGSLAESERSPSHCFSRMRRSELRGCSSLARTLRVERHAQRH
jgi:type VI protein secretion system component VasA